MITVKHKIEGDLKEFKKLLKKFQSVDILVGIPEDAIPYPDGTGTAMVAAVHEFGAPSINVPERSFLRSTIDEKRADYIDLFIKGFNKALEGSMEPKKVFSLIGLQAQTDVQKKIQTISKPALKKATIKAKGSEKPLIDTGHLLQSIRYEVKEGEE
jgi:phage gpG-like protein